MEAFLANNDEFIMEAAHQAAEAVAHSGSPDNAVIEGQPALAALAQELRHLEEAGRHAGERTHRTFEALHDTLIQIAERLAHMEERISAEVERQGSLSGELLEEIMKVELGSALNQEKPKSGLLAGISRRFSQAG
jgi:localization factor PodJL